MDTQQNRKNEWPRLVRNFIMTAALLFAALPAKAEDYVLAYVNGGTTYYLARNGMTGVQRVTSFNPTTCIWSCSSAQDGNTPGTLNNSNAYGYLYQTVGSTKYFLGAADNDFSLATNVPTNYYRWRTNGTYVYNRFGNGTSYYINLANATPERNTTANTTSNARPYTFTISDIETTSSNPTINGADLLTATGNSTYTATGASYSAGYTNYRFNNTDHYVYDNAAITPAAATLTNSWSLTGNAYATVNNAGVVTVSSLPESDITLTLTVTVAVTGGTPAAPSGTTLTASKEITIQGINPAEPTITRTGNTVSIATTSAGVTIYYTTDGSTPTASSTLYTGPFDLTTSPTTVKTIAIRDGHSSTVASETLQMQLAAPVITISNTGLATITAEAGATIHYTTDGTTPTTSSPTYSAPVQLTNPQTIMAIAMKANYTTSSVAMDDYITGGVSGGKVILDDREDHRWTYYAGVDAGIDGGNYNTNYLGKLYSPNPRNVKITYRGKNDVAGSSTVVRVSISENDSVLIYMKTLEEGATSGEYPYQVISNPFSVRPSTGTGGSKVYYGFAGWKIISGGEYIKGKSNGSVLALDEEITFENLPYATVNCTSAEIVLQTSWTTANVQTGNNISTMFGNFSGGTYETNFAVLTGTYTTAWTANKNATITSVYPDGSTDSRSGVNTRLNLTLNDGYTVKYEYIHINNNNSTFSMGSGTKTLYIGRGVDNTTANEVCCNLIQGYGNANITGGLTYTLKIESGIYNYLSFIKGYDGARTDYTVTGTVAVKGVLGCDYDRAKNDNTKLKIQQQIMMGYAESATLLRSTTAGQEVLNVTLKSGSLISSRTDAGTADVAQSFYIGIAGQYSAGYRVFTMEGGEMWNLAAGICQNTATTNSIRFRIKGGLIKGSIYGSAANANSYGYKQMILTGGQVKGWIAGGGNGTSANGGTTTGSSYLYVGGTCRVDSEGSNTKINSSLGGNVFGSGSGVENTTTWGEMLYGSNVVIADDAYIERNAFGGGNFGWTDQYATIYLTGNEMSVDNVYGGANQNKGDNVKIYMTGGTVRNGLYGGSNTSGTINYNVEMHVDGGTVGNSETGDGVFGGGYGASTIVTGNVSVTLGASTTATDSATVNGNVFGGAYGNGANVNGRITVNVNGGRINGNVFGGGDAAAYSKAGQNYPVVNMTGGQATNVFGGGKGPTAVVTGNPQVTLSGTAHVTGNVYGGGDAAEVSGHTNVELRD